MLRGASSLGLLLLLRHVHEVAGDDAGRRGTAREAVRHAMGQLDCRSGVCVDARHLADGVQVPAVEVGGGQRGRENMVHGKLPFEVGGED